MARSHLAIAILLCAAASCLAQSFTRDSLREEIARLRTTVAEDHFAEALSSLPERWVLEADGQQYPIATAPLKTLLEKMPPDAAAAEAWLNQLERHATVDDPAPPNTDARQRLTAILARDEFHNVRPPSAWEEFRARVGAWLVSLLQQLFRFLPSSVPGAEIFFWIILTAAVGILGMLLFRYWMHRGRPEGFAAPEVHTHEGRTWEQWLRAAQEAAARNDAPEAIRCGYWAGVSRLQVDRVLPAKLSQTPRELVGHARESQAPRALVESLTTLTRSFEHFWYGRGTAGADDVRESFRTLEALGCRLD